MSQLSPDQIADQPQPDGGARPPALNVRETMTRLWPAIVRADLVRFSSIVFVSVVASRILAFLFTVAAARILGPSDYGLLAYGIAIVGIATVLVTIAPLGLSRFLSLHRDRKDVQAGYFGSWLAVVAGALALSTIVGVPAAALFGGLDGWMTLALAANLLGVCVLETYKEALRGLERFTISSIYLGLAAALQLVAILLAGAAGWRSPSLFLTLYGLSSVGAWGMVQLVRPVPLKWSVAALSSTKIRQILRFIAPLVIQTAFYAVWFGVDLILVRQWLSVDAAGTYAVAKTVTLGLTLPGGTVARVAGPRLARLEGDVLLRYAAAVGVLGTAVTVASLLALVAVGPDLLRLIFGSRYSVPSAALTLLAVGMAVHGLYLLLDGGWIARGRTDVPAITTAVGMVVTVPLCLLFVPRLGLAGGGLGFSAGAAAMLLAAIGYTAVALRRHWRRPR